MNLTASISRIISCATLLSMLAISSPSQAKTLVLVNESTTGHLKLYVNRDSIQRQGGYIWFNTETIKNFPNGSLLYHVRELQRADCSKFIYQTRATHIFIDNEAGIKNRLIEQGDAGKVRRPPAGTVAYSALKHVCFP